MAPFTTLPASEPEAPSLPWWKALWARLCAKPAHPRLFVLLSLLLGPLAALYATQVVWLQSLWKPFPWMVLHLPAVGLFWLLFSSVSLTLYGFIRRLFPAFIPEVGLFMGVAVSSRYKFDINGMPIQLSDFTLIENLGEVTSFAAKQLIPPVMTVLGVVVAAILTETLRRKETWKPGWKPGLVLGLVSGAVCACAFFPGPLQSAAVALDQDCMDQIERSERSGVVLGLYTAWAQRQAEARGESDGYYLGLAQRFREESRAPGEALPLDQAPDILFVTSESFFDITRLSGIYFADDPLPTYHALAEQGTSGAFLSNNYGGGTGNVEMEMFTALSKNFLLEGDSLCTMDSAFYRDVPSVVRSLKKAGYQTISVHSYTDELYGRRSNYPAIGFDQLVFQDDFLTQPVIDGAYISDVSFAQELIARYEARDPSAPCFLYGMSMENHQAYEAGKYDTPSGYPAACAGMSQEDLAIVDALVHGLHGADESLKLLTDYFSQVERPVLLVFVGDHLPSINLNDGVSLYTHLRCSPTDNAADWDAETLKEILSTNYLIWSNYETEPAPDRDESCTFLGLHVLERAGVPLGSYFTWLSQNITPSMLQVRGRLFVDQEGAPSYSPTPQQRQVQETYAALEKAMVYDSFTAVEADLEE